MCAGPRTEHFVGSLSFALTAMDKGGLRKSPLLQLGKPRLRDVKWIA